MKKIYEKPRLEIERFEIEEDIANIGNSGTTMADDGFLFSE